MPDVEIVHLRGRSRADVPAATQAAYRRSHIAFYDKHHPALGALPAPLPALRRGELPDRRADEGPVQHTPAGVTLYHDGVVRIGIDARKLHDFGIGTYVQNLLRQPGAAGRGAEYVLFCRADDCEALAAWARTSGPWSNPPAYSVAGADQHPVALAGSGSRCSTAPTTSCRR